ncbi:bacillithiol transferase BstA [Zeaxanthinibacter sp. PT1]|uniref:YfiT family bacillithiol transferase n=1 Tax=Zeaxanthinibacter TaxID=561554 RepID=UPI00234BBB45|nr:bacillithiol transferase BstA [Zeaxanthinibacter sp. PT1]MDC6352494.1 bacillithiol transferase BstA [Zeaxanthinibacter sp. PT1]
MNADTLETLRYPIGHFVKPEVVTELILADWIAELEALPVDLEDLVSGFTKSQLDTPYREGGWTVRQVVHHLADSHHHSYTRFKWALTENSPVIKAYDEKKWAELPDTKSAPIDLSLQHLKIVHLKLVKLLREMSKEDFNRDFIHPVGERRITLEENAGHYAWHGKHHFAHIERLAQREGWIPAL